MIDIQDVDLKKVRSEFRLWEENDEWISRNYSALVKEYNRKWIAVKDKKVVASRMSFNKLLNTLNKSKLKTPDMEIRYITDEKFLWVL